MLPALHLEGLLLAAPAWPLPPPLIAHPRRIPTLGGLGLPRMAGMRTQQNPGQRGQKRPCPWKKPSALGLRRASCFVNKVPTTQRAGTGLARPQCHPLRGPQPAQEPFSRPDLHYRVPWLRGKVLGGFLTPWPPRPQGELGLGSQCPTTTRAMHPCHPFP